MSTEVQKFQDYTFTYFRNVKAPKSIIEQAMEIEQFDKLVREDEGIKKMVQQYRDYGTGVLKEQLPCVSFSGVFNYRDSKGLIRHSKLICLDIDDIPYADELKECLKGENYIHYMFKSPSGNGLKVIIKIEATTLEEHLKYYLALETYFSD